MIHLYASTIHVTMKITHANILQQTQHNGISPSLWKNFPPMIITSTTPATQVPMMIGRNFSSDEIVTCRHESFQIHHTQFNSIIQVILQEEQEQEQKEEQEEEQQQNMDNI